MKAKHAKVSVVGEILESFNYEDFKILGGNRSINRLHVEELKESITEEYLLKPIDVNQDLEIIDGQHRFTALQELEMPIHFIVHKKWGLKQVQRLNSYQNNWTSLDYMEAYVNLGYKEYKKFKKFQDDYGFGFQVTLALTGDFASVPRGKSYKSFKNGTFFVEDMEKAQSIAEKILAFEPYYDGVRRDNFCFAIMRLLRRDDYDNDEMLRKVSVQSMRLTHQSTIKDYVSLLEDIYNHSRKQKVRWF